MTNEQSDDEANRVVLFWFLDEQVIKPNTIDFEKLLENKLKADGKYESEANAEHEQGEYDDEDGVTDNDCKSPLTFDSVSALVSAWLPQIIASFCFCIHSVVSNLVCVSINATTHRHCCQMQKLFLFVPGARSRNHEQEQEVLHFSCRCSCSDISTEIERCSGSRGGTDENDN